MQHELGDRTKSLADLDKYLDLKGEVSVAYFKRAHLFRRRGDLERAYTEVGGRPISIPMTGKCRSCVRSFFPTRVTNAGRART